MVVIVVVVVVVVVVVEVVVVVVVVVCSFQFFSHLMLGGVISIFRLYLFTNDYKRICFRTKFLKRRPRLNMPLNALVCTLAFGIALPFAIALFPQRSMVSDSLLGTFERNF